MPHEPKFETKGLGNFKKFSLIELLVERKIVSKWSLLLLVTFIAIIVLLKAYIVIIIALAAVVALSKFLPDIIKDLETWHAKNLVAKDRKKFAKLNSAKFNKSLAYNSSCFNDEIDIGTAYYCVTGYLGDIPYWFGNYKTRDLTARESEITGDSNVLIGVFLGKQVPNVAILANKLGFAHDAVLPIAGDAYKISHEFEKRYTTYIEHGLERDILYFLTPELLEIIYDSKVTGVEFIDNMVLIQIPGLIVNPKEYAKIETLINTIGAECIENTKNYKNSAA